MAESPRTTNDFERPSTVAEYLKAAEAVAKKTLASRKSARAFLVKAGILDKSGKKLAAPYR